MTDEGTLRAALEQSPTQGAVQEGWGTIVERQTDGTYHLWAPGQEGDDFDTRFDTLEAVEGWLDGEQGLSTSSGSRCGWEPEDTPTLKHLDHDHWYVHDPSRLWLKEDGRLHRWRDTPVKCAICGRKRGKSESSLSQRSLCT